MAERIIKKIHVFYELQIMSLDNFQKGSCFSVNFDHSDSHRNCPDRKTCIKKVFWVQAQAYASIHKLKK